MTHIVDIPDELIAKYDKSLPRYTSYPTAPHFHSSFTAEDYVQHARLSNEQLLPKPLSLYVHIPFCHSLCYFCGCNKVVTQPGAAKIEHYLDALIAEIRHRASLFDQDRFVQQIHFGGGTPNFLSVQQLGEILEEIARAFHLDLPSRLEVGIELDPRHSSPEQVSQLAEIGFNRFSIGVQDATQAVQEAINRVQSLEATKEIIEVASQYSDSVNVDLITGLPKQTDTSISETLEHIVTSGASRIAAYSFAYMPERIRAQKLIQTCDLPDTKKRLELNHLLSRLLMQAGFEHIGMDHFTLANDSLYQALQNGSLQRNFQGYTTHAQTELVGIGVSAISSFDTAYAQNTSSISDYLDTIGKDCLPIVRGISLSEDDQLRHKVIQAIMCSGELNLSIPVEECQQLDFSGTIGDYFKSLTPVLTSFEDEGILTISGDKIRLTPLGRFFMRPVAACFDAYLHPIPNNNGSQKVARFSRAL